MSRWHQGTEPGMLLTPYGHRDVPSGEGPRPKCQQCPVGNL